MIGEALELRRLMNNRRLSPAELEAVRDQKLQAMIRHAYENVPLSIALSVCRPVAGGYSDR